MATAHIMYDGQTYDVNMDDLDVGVLSTDQEIRNAISEKEGIPLNKINRYMIDRNEETGNVTLRPEAVFG